MDGAQTSVSEAGALTLSRVKRGPQRKWTREENDRIAQLYQSGVRPIEIASLMGTTRNTIKAKLKTWGLVGKFRRVM
jgi:transposase-like protein